MKEIDEVLTQILQAADKHPNSKVSKLIREVLDEPSQKNIVLLLIELSEHSEFATDFGISLKYYLDLYERLGVDRDLVLNEAGLLLLSSSKIYSRRVDYVQELVERQISTLSSTDQEIEKSKNDAQQLASNAEKPKRGRKRLVEAPSDPFEVELIPKKIRKLSAEKRFAVVAITKAQQTAAKLKATATSQRNLETEQYVHPTLWQHAHIIDLENDDEIDSKRNYKLFTYHIEHRYNTLVPDINFRLHFKVKDYIDAEEEERIEEQERMEEEDEMRAEAARRMWPPLSEAYVQKYLSLESHILSQEHLPLPKRTQFEALENTIPLENNLTLAEHFGDAEAEEDVPLNISTNPALEQVQNLILSDTAEGNKDATLDATTLNASATDSTQNDSGLGDSLLDGTKSSGDDSANASTTSICDVDKSINEATTSGIDKNSEPSTETAPLDQVQNLNGTTENSFSLECNTNLLSIEDQLSSTTANDSALGHSIATVDESMKSNESAATGSILEQSLSNATLPENVTITDASETVLEETKIVSEGGQEIVSNTLGKAQRMDSGIHNSLDNAETLDLAKSINLTEENIMSKKDGTQINLDEIRVLLPHLDDEGVFFSDLDEHEHRMLSPTVVATDVFPCIPNKKNITIIVDDEIKAMLSLDDDDEPETYLMPVERHPAVTTIVHNIFKFHEKFLKRRTLFKLGPEMDLFLQARSLKRKRTRTVPEPREYQSKMMKVFALNSTDMSGVIMTPPSSPGRDSEEDFCGFSVVGDEDTQDFLGFSEESQQQKEIGSADECNRLSRDSGVGADFTKANFNTIKEEDSGVESAGNSESLESCVRELFGDSNVSKTVEVGVSSAVETNVEIISTETMAVATAEVAANIEENLNSDTETTTLETNRITPEVTNETPPEESSTSTEAVAEQTNAEKSMERNLESFDCVNNDKAIDDKLNETLANIELSNSKTKIQKWHEHLQPILAKSRERHHFDVFEIGTEIMEKLQPSDDDAEDDENAASSSQRKCITFADVMQNKDESYVSRYFLSSLLLGNQNNIKFTVHNKSSETPSAWSDVQLEVLSTQRHTVAMEDNIGMINTKSQKTSAQEAVNSKSKQKLANSMSSDDDFPCSSTSSTIATNMTPRVSNHFSAKVIPPIGRRDSSTAARPMDHLNVNLNVVKPLKQIEKLPRNSDDYDSGIFSSEELVS